MLIFDPRDVPPTLPGPEEVAEAKLLGAARHVPRSSPDYGRCVVCRAWLAKVKIRVCSPACARVRKTALQKMRRRRRRR